MSDSEETPQTPAAVLGELSETLEEVASGIKDAITPEAATDTPAPTAEPEAASSPAEPPASVLASVPAAPVLDQLIQGQRLMHDNLSLASNKMEHHSGLFAEASNELRDLLTEAKDTLTLHQQVVGEFDQHVEHLGLIASALTKMHKELLAALGKGKAPETSETSES
jgi:hypothetical protein